jgi:hypothetical protein
MATSIYSRTSIGIIPDAFAYHPDFINEEEQHRLVETIERLEFSEVRMHGMVAKRRVAHFGWNYGYETWRISPGPPVPEFLLPLRARVAELLKIEAAAFEEVLVTEYPPGAVIGWPRCADVRSCCGRRLAVGSLPDAISAGQRHGPRNLRTGGGTAVRVRAKRSRTQRMAAQHSSREKLALLRDLPHPARIAALHNCH